MHQGVLLPHLGQIVVGEALEDRFEAAHTRGAAARGTAVERAEDRAQPQRVRGVDVL